MESEEAPVASFRVRWEVVRHGDTHYHLGCPSPCWEMPWASLVKGKSRKVPVCLGALQMSALECHHPYLV